MPALDDATHDALAIAAAAGLRYRTDDRPGISRRRRGRGFSYVDARGKLVSAKTRERLVALAIPPAWRDVWIAPEANAHLLATGVDAAGRKQYLYHPAWREAADASKFVRLAGFARVLERLRQRVHADLRAESEDRVCAAAIRLVDESLIRPGSRRQRSDSGAVGVTTLDADDIEISRSVIVLEFVGKGGVDQRLEVRDPQLAKVLSDLLDSSSRADALFTTAEGDSIDENQLNDYIARHAGDGYSAKDFRTWGATAIVLAELAVASSIDDDAERDAAVRDAIEAAAIALGNTPAVCRGSYVAPAVLDAYGDGRLGEHWQRSRAGKWLSRPERALARLLSATVPATSPTATKPRPAKPQRELS